MKLDHFSLRTDDLDAMKDFFCEVVELEVGERPPFKFPGYWLYDREGGPAIVHLIGRDGPPGADTGAVDHMAFKGDGARYDEISAHIESLDYPQERRTVPGAGLRQIFVTGPYGFVVELNFPPAD